MCIRDRFSKAKQCTIRQNRCLKNGTSWFWRKAYGLQLTYGMKCCILRIDHAFQLRLVIYWVIAFAFVASGSGYCILKMNNFMQLLILLLVFGRGACTIRGVRNIFNADATGGGDQRRRKSWQEWKYTGPPNFQPDECPDDDNPASWLKFANQHGFVTEWSELRRPCFYKGSLCT